MDLPLRITAEHLERFVPLAALRPESRSDLARKAVVSAFKAGDYLFRCGEPAPTAFYLMQGQIELRDATGIILTRYSADSPEAHHRVAHHSPRRVDARCLTEVACLELDARLLDVMLTWDQTDALEVGELSGGADDPSDDWMTRLLQTPAFQMVPPANLQAIFMKMEQLDAVPGQVIVRQGDTGDFFYVIIDGRCIVTREQPNQKPVQLAQLEAGSCFGEEALISDSPRNATVTMLTRGSLMRLAKDDFQHLLKEPLTRRLSRAQADEMIQGGGAQYLDVRLPSEFLNTGLPKSLNMPLYMLRMRLNQLNPQTAYICVCDTGRRSSVASFVLTHKGFNAYMLDEGLSGPS